ncbi:MAG: hypothetical protein OXG04_11350 [Acidobacteria bacterium]|nr:hypothetical protein [Acidobacteriota bacterium]
MGEIRTSVTLENSADREVVYQGALGGRFRYFPHNLPVAVDRERAVFLFVQVCDDTENAVRTWGAQHAALWTALAAAGRASRSLSSGATRCVWRRRAGCSTAGRGSRWRRPRSGDETATRVCEQARHEEEVESIRAAITKVDHAALAAYGGLNGAIARCIALKADATEARGPKPLITTGRDAAVSESAGRLAEPGRVTRPSASDGESRRGPARQGAGAPPPRSFRPVG